MVGNSFAKEANIRYSKKAISKFKCHDKKK